VGMENAMSILATTTLLVLLMASNAYATSQASDWIIYKGQKFALDMCPMEEYFIKHPEKNPKREVQSTSLARNYVATFEFQNNSLVLKDIETLVRLDSNTMDPTVSWKSAKGLIVLDPIISWKSVKNQIVTEGEAFKIDWLSRILVLGYGNYVDRFYGIERTYSNYILLSVKNGNLTGEREFDSKGYEKFKEKQFQSFKKTEAYKQESLEIKKYLEKWGGDTSQENIDSTLQDTIVSHTSEFLY
jgi:hypothetical protein